MTRARRLLHTYGITEEQYNQLYEKQDGCCAVCKRHSSMFKVRLCVDHEHSEEGQVRGLLCHFCNRRVIGRWKRSSLGLLKSAYDYLNQEYTGWIVPPKTKTKRKRKCKKRGKK